MTAASRPVALMGFAEALAAPEAVWSLIDDGFGVVAFARTRKQAPIRRAKGVEVIEIPAPEEDLTEALAALIQLAERVKPVAVMPLDDIALALCARAFPASSGVTLAGPSGEAADFALDKRLQLDAARLAGLDVPDTVVIEQLRDLDRIRTFPVAVKPARAAVERDGRLLRRAGGYCSDRGALERLAERLSNVRPLLVQTWVRGVGEGVFGIASEDGVAGLSAHRRVRMMNPAGSGSSACESRSLDEAVADAVTRFVKSASWRGIFMVELLRDERGIPWFVEFNGRTWGSTALARRLGLEYPAWGMRLALGQPFEPPPPWVHDRLVCRHLGRELVHLLFVLRGPRDQSADWPRRSRTVAKLLHVSRRQRWYNWRRDEKAVFFDDVVQTVARQVRGRR